MGSSHSPSAPRGSFKFSLMVVKFRMSGRASRSNRFAFSVASAALFNVFASAFVSCRMLVSDSLSIATVWSSCAPSSGGSIASSQNGLLLRLQFVKDCVSREKTSVNFPPFSR